MGSPNDIANFVNKSKQLCVDAGLRKAILVDTWVPACTFKFPGSGKRNLKFQWHWLNRWNWLAYSQIEDGAFCKYCVLFSSHGAGSGHQPLGKLVKNKFNNWKDAVEDFNRHEMNEYHKCCVLKAVEFERIAAKKQDPVDLQIDTGLKQQVEDNRKKIVPIIETIIMFGRQNLSLRGHRDHGPIDLSEEEPVENDGTFRALLRFRAKAGDKDLERHFETKSLNAMYISPQTQNEIIDACKEFILNNIVSRVNKAQCFTILADETTDIAGVEQMSLCTRYIDTDTEKVREDFLLFVPVTDVTGRGLASKILETLEQVGVELKYLRGQGYDGASTMSGQFNGVQSVIREKYPLALYMHCSSHVLNLAITEACSVQGIRNCMGVVGNVCSFFRYPKKMNDLKRSIEKNVPESNKTKLKSLCNTRYLENSTGVGSANIDQRTFLNHLCLQIISPLRLIAYQRAFGCAMRSLVDQSIQTRSFVEGSIKCLDNELQLKPTLMGGQCFRWKQLQTSELESGDSVHWRGVFNNHVWTLSQLNNNLSYKVFNNTSELNNLKKNSKKKLTLNSSSKVKDSTYFEDMLTEYLRLDENLEKLYSDWSSRDPDFKESAKKFFGIRVLKQDPVENIFSFICSTNNNIARITSMVEKLCTFYGEKLTEVDGTTYFDFPKVSALAAKGVEDKLRKEGFGYRAKYIHHSAVKIMDHGGDSWLGDLQTLPYLEAKQQLMTLPGIGAKVADCICLMSLNHLEAIPVDTHVFQISQRYLPHLKSCKTVTDKVYNEIVNYFQNLYGKYAGWAHSVLFCADLRQFQSSSSKDQTQKPQKGVKRKLK